jgi:hypothetical protein
VIVVCSKIKFSFTCESIFESSNINNSNVLKMTNFSDNLTEPKNSLKFSEFFKSIPTCLKVPRRSSLNYFEVNYLNSRLFLFQLLQPTHTEHHSFHTCLQSPIRERMLKFIQIFKILFRRLNQHLKQFLAINQHILLQLVLKQLNLSFHLLG